MRMRTGQSLPIIPNRSKSAQLGDILKKKDRIFSQSILHSQKFRTNQRSAERVYSSVPQQQKQRQKNYLHLPDRLVKQVEAILKRHPKQQRQSVYSSPKTSLPAVNSFDILPQKVLAEPVSLRPSMWREMKLQGERTVMERKSHSMVAYEGRFYIQRQKRLYIYGGNNNSNSLGDFWCCYPHEQNWRWEVITSSGDSPGPLCCHSAVVLQGKMLIYGGQEKLMVFNSKLYQYDFKSSVWTSAEARPGELRNHTANTYQDTMLLVYGVGLDYSNDIWQYKVETDDFSCLEIKGQKPVSRSSHSSAINNDKLYIFGGQRDGKRLKDFWTLDLGTLTYTKMKQEILPMISGATLNSWSDKLILFGGLKNIMYENGDIYLYNIQKDEWKLLQQDPLQMQNQSTIPSNQGSSRVLNIEHERKLYHKGTFIDHLAEKRTHVYHSQVSVNAHDSSMLSRNSQMSINRKEEKIQRYQKHQFLKIFETDESTRRKLLVITPTTESLRYSIKMVNGAGKSPTWDQRIQIINKDRPVARDNHTAIILNDYMYVFGGDRHKMCFNDMFELDLKQLN